MEDEKIRLCLFGRPRVEGGGATVDKFLTRRSIYLLARLAIEPRKMLSRFQLAEILWPGDYYDATSVRLRQELARLRRALGSFAGIVTNVAGSVCLDTTNLLIDVLEFEDILNASECRPRQDLEYAAEIGSAPFMAGSKESWICAERTRLRNLRCQILAELDDLTQPS